MKTNKILNLFDWQWSSSVRGTGTGTDNYGTGDSGTDTCGTGDGGTASNLSDCDATAEWWEGGSSSEESSAPKSFRVNDICGNKYSKVKRMKLALREAALKVKMAKLSFKKFALTVNNMSILNMYPPSILFFFMLPLI